MDTNTDRKLNTCIVLLVLILAGVGWADYMLARVDSVASLSPVPVVTRWIDTSGLEQNLSTRREPGESDDALDARHKAALTAALRYFPCKEFR